MTIGDSSAEDSSGGGGWWFASAPPTTFAFGTRRKNENDPCRFPRGFFGLACFPGGARRLEDGGGILVIAARVSPSAVARPDWSVHV
ncbi:hypothetical protein NL676_023240 [Syzygium grande]|nr:hypothetical protein NL676_023240 [Syzygium grande]